MKEEILALRDLGVSISEISHRTGYSLTEICEVLYRQNQEDIENDSL